MAERLAAAHSDLPSSKENNHDVSEYDAWGGLREAVTVMAAATQSECPDGGNDTRMSLVAVITINVSLSVMVLRFCWKEPCAMNAFLANKSSIYVCDDGSLSRTLF